MSQQAKVVRPEYFQGCFSFLWLHVSCVCGFILFGARLRLAHDVWQTQHVPIVFVTYDPELVISLSSAVTHWS